MLGHDVVRAAAGSRHELTAPPSTELDVTDAQAMEDAVSESRAQMVINCAGYTNVDGAEEEPDEALRVNAAGARVVAAAAARRGAGVLYVSTDYVFDGSKRAPYLESDEPRPLSSYGRSKLAGERETAAATPRHFVVRSSWLFGAHGRNFVDTMLSAGRERGEVTVVRDQVGSPTYTGHLAGGLLQLAGSDAYGLHHLAAGGECSWYDFAREIFRQAGVECHVMPCTTEDFGRPAARPGFSVLESARPGATSLPHWRTGLRNFLAEREVRA
jgi:dTDP-4-dehydrorhamnose reductase